MKVPRIRDAEDRITPDAIASSATNLVKAGAVVLVVRSGILKHSLPVAVTDVGVALNQDMKALQPADGGEASYVAWALRANAQKILHSCTKAGTTVQSIEMPAFLDFDIPLPQPDEQRNVVADVEARLSLLDASVAGLHRVQANLKRYTKSLIQSLTTPAEGSLWPSACVDDIAQSLDNLRKPVNKTERALRGGDIPYLGANGQTGWIDEPLFDEELVLVVEDETFVGRTQPFCYYFAGKCWVNNHTHVLRAKPGIVTAKYLNFALSYYPFIPLTTGSTGRRKLTKKALMTAPLSIPPLAEQHRIVAEADRRLSLIRVAEAQVAANLARAQRLRQSILQAAFSSPASAEPGAIEAS